MNAFLDTNVSISYIFKIDSLNIQAKNVFREYENFFISQLVKNEIDDVFVEKRGILSHFFNDLSKNLKLENNKLVSMKDLENYLNNQNFSHSEIEKIKSSLKEFWLQYINETFPTYPIVENGVNNCLNDLDITIFSKKEELEKILKITQKRKNKYTVIKKELEKLCVHKKDIEIILDAHDHNTKTDYNLDFITFDEDFYKGASKIKEFQFRKIKGKNDFFTKFN